MRIRRLFIIILLVSVFYSCGVSKKQSGDFRPPKPQIEHSDSDKVAYKTFSVQYKGSYNGIPFKMQFRARHDSVIWVSVTSFIGEVLRGQITKDSVYLLDKIHSDVYIVSKNTLEKEYGQKIDNREIEKFITDSTDGEKNFALTKPFAAELSFKKQHLKTGARVFDINLKQGGSTYSVRVTESSIEYDLSQQYPFPIPKNATIKRL